MLVFVAAERRELEGLLGYVEDAGRPGWPLDFARRGQLNGVPVALIANGPGPKLAGAALDFVKDRERMDAFISTGFCGGLVPSLDACAIFAATEVIGFASARLPSSSRPFATGKLLSIDRVAATAAEKMELAKTGASAIEMEAAAVAERARDWNVPFFAIRVVTDTRDENLPLEFNQMRSSDGRFSRARILGAALRRPLAVFPELVKLNSRTKSAAQALGDFLADCRF